MVSGIGLTFAMWWVYFGASSGDLLHHYRDRSFSFGYLHLPVFASIAAVGAGLHVAASQITGEATISQPAVVASVAIPVLVFVASVNAFYYAVHRGARGGHQRFHGLLLLLTAVVITLAVAMAAWHVPLGWCLIVVTLGPWVTVIGYETVGHRHIAADEATLLAARDEG